MARDQGHREELRRQTTIAPTPPAAEWLQIHVSSRELDDRAPGFTVYLEVEAAEAHRIDEIAREIVGLDEGAVLPHSTAPSMMRGPELAITIRASDQRSALQAAQSIWDEMCSRLGSSAPMRIADLHPPLNGANAPSVVLDAFVEAICVDLDEDLASRVRGKRERFDGGEPERTLVARHFFPNSMPSGAVGAPAEFFRCPTTMISIRPSSSVSSRPPRWSADNELPAHDQLRGRREGRRLDAVHCVLVIFYSMSLSADGYIAGPDGSFDWAVPSQELHRFHNERVAAIDAQLLGRRLYETMLVWDTEEFSDPAMAEFAEIWRPLEKIVFSTTLTSVEGSNRLATGTLEEEIAALGDRRIAVGGAGLAAECMRRGLIDEFELFVIPIVVGGGTPYFPPDVHIDLELVETRTFGATVYLHYRRRS